MPHGPAPLTARLHKAFAAHGHKTGMVACTARAAHYRSGAAARAHSLGARTARRRGIVGRRRGLANGAGEVGSELRRGTHPRRRRQDREVVDDQRCGSGRREARQHDTENAARRLKRVRHGGRIPRRTGIMALTCGDGGEFEQWRWHAATDHGWQHGAQKRQSERARGQ
jgi:hypothetical protein